MKKYSYDFSVVMSVYNMKKYMRESIDSVIHQTIGFEKIQLILVDDGSSDGSSGICDEYKAKYPESIDVIHKPNGGLSSARNTGLTHVRGKYVTYTDPDDILSKDAFQKVFSFMEQHEEADICCIPMLLFGDQEGHHLLNYKFDEGSRVIDLSKNENAYFVLLHACSSFYREEIARKMSFDTVIYTAEDAKENLKLLLENPLLGVVSDTAYHYRRHGNSIVAGSQRNKKWYTTYLIRFPRWIFDYARERKGHIPKYIQYAVMYDLQWKVQQSHIDANVLTEDEKKEYVDLLIDTISQIDDDVISNQKNLETERKLYLLYKKNGNLPPFCSEKKGNTGLKNSVAYDDLITKICFMRFEDDYLICEGSQAALHFGPELTKLYILVNSKIRIEAERVKFESVLYVTDVPIANRVYFCAKIPLKVIRKMHRAKISFMTEYGKARVLHNTVMFERYSPISNFVDKSWFRCGSYTLKPLQNGFRILYQKSWAHLSDIMNEARFLKQLSTFPYKGAKKAVILRTVYHVLHPILPKDIWLITDKADRADDNGEAFFRYLVGLGKKANCHPIFAVGKTTPDYKRIKKIGRVVPYMSWRYKMLHLLAEHTVSAYSHDEISTPFHEYSFYYGDILQHNHIIFLQHGIIKDDISKGYHRFHKNFAMFVTSVDKEHDSVLYGNYAYNERQVALTGLPRYDLLYSNTKNYITIMPTWVRSLCGNYNAKDSSWELLPGFEQSDYYNFYTDLLNNDKLLSTAESKGYKVRFLIHPVFHRYVDRFHFDKRVEVLHSDVCYRDVFAESALITTDYSSAVFDFAYLKKPIIYTQFEDNHYEVGYFDYERDGLGEVEHTVDGSVDRIIEYMENGCQLKEKYEKRIDDFFHFHDKRNCERVYRHIKSLDANNG